MKPSIAMNYKVVAYIKSIISPMVHIMDVYMEGKWVVAVLSSNMRFKIRNDANFV